MKKLSLLFIGANLLFSLPVNAAPAIKKRRSFECQSDKNISLVKTTGVVPEFLATVSDIDGQNVNFLVKKNVVIKNELKTLTLAKEKTRFEDSNNYLTIQGNQWALAIAPEKKRASLYNMNPDVNEVPMFCLSLQ